MYTHGGAYDQGVLSISGIVIQFLLQDQSSSVARFEGEFSLLVALYNSVVHVAVRSVRFVFVERVDSSEYRKTCNFFIIFWR